MLIRFLPLGLMSIAVACIGRSDKGAPGDPGPSDTGADVIGFNPDGDVRAPCGELKCQRVACPGDVQTTLTGIVKDPAGNVPLYNVVAYIPNADLAPIPTGVSCDKCGTLVSGSPITTALTDSKGQFVLNDVPVGTNITLVIQVGKWRKKITVPRIDACIANNAGDVNLPKNHTEGDIPKIAIATGGADTIECVFKKMGIDDWEFTDNTGTGQIHIYRGAAGAYLSGGSPAANTFWGDRKKLDAYDMVILSCEAGEHPETKPPSTTTAMRDYANAGGKIFASHFAYYWFQHGPADFKSTAIWDPGGLSGDGDYDIDTSFPKGKSFADWLFNVKASTTKGKIFLQEVRSDVSEVTKGSTQRWIYRGSPKYMSFNTPVGQKPESQCGRAVFTDIHVGSGNTPGKTFPTGCTSTLSAQEKALEFLLFDLASCVQGDDKEPIPPSTQ